MQRAHRIAVHVQGRQWLSFERCRHIFDGWTNVTHGISEVGLQITAPNDAFFGFDIDQNEWPFVELPHFRYDGATQGYGYGANADALEGEFF